MAYLDKDGLTQLWTIIQESLNTQQQAVDNLEDQVGVNTTKIENMYSYGDTLPETGTEGQVFFLHS